MFKNTLLCGLPSELIAKNYTVKRIDARYMYELIWKALSTSFKMLNFYFFNFLNFVVKLYKTQATIKLRQTKFASKPTYIRTDTNIQSSALTD